MTTAPVPQDDNIQLAVTHRGGVAIITVRGPVDLLTTHHLSERIEAVLAESPVALILDFARVTFMGSSGLQALVEAKHLAGEQTPVVVVADGRSTSRVIKLTGLDKMVPMFDTLDEAAHSVATPPAPR